MKKIERELTIFDIDLHKTTIIILKKNNIDTIRELRQLSAGNLRDFGATAKVIAEIRKKLAAHDTCLFGDVLVRSTASITLAQTLSDELSRISLLVKEMKNNISCLMQDANSNIFKMNNNIGHMKMKINEFEERLNEIILKEQ